MKTIAIVGATGLVGEKLVALAENLPKTRLRLYGNSSVGRHIKLRRGVAVVENCDALPKEPPDYALFMTPSEVSARYIPPLVKMGTVCIDNSAHFRLKKDVPLVVSCINGQQAIGKKLIANPNCSTIQVAVALNALLPLHPTKMVAVTFQSVSGAGREALGDWQQRRGYGSLTALRHPIWDNLIPMIGEPSEGGFTSEERKLTNESRKILSLPRLRVNAMCVRVPVSVCHGVFVNVTLREKFELGSVRDMLCAAPNVLLMDEPERGLYPMPITLRNTKYVGVGRLTRDPTGNALNFFCVADNLLRGAAYNAYEILQDKLKEELCS